MVRDGIKLKKSQLDNKMYEIPYVSKGKKSWGKIPKGEIYKTVYYWTCHIKDLKEIGLTSEVVPRNQLQAAEVDWAGFVPANEIDKRIAPVMGSIIKHINMNEAKDKHDILSAIEKDIKKGNTQKFELNNDDIYYWASKLKVKINDDEADWVMSMLDESANEDLIPGGLADKHTPETLAKLHNVSIDLIKQQIKKGIKVEAEHVGNNLDMAAEIAMDHLVEMPDYYDKLEQIEPTGTHEGFKIKSLNEWVSLNEKYYSYDDFKKSKWGDPGEMKSDVETSLRNAMPSDSFKIKSIDDESNDNGIKFVIKLDSGDTVHAYKTSQWRGEYEWFLNKKKVTKYDIQEYVFSKLKPLDVYLRHLKGHDWYHQYADDHRSWKAGESATKKLVDLYSKLSSGDKKKAVAEYNKLAPKDRANVDIKTFKGI